MKMQNLGFRTLSLIAYSWIFPTFVLLGCTDNDSLVAGKWVIDYDAQTNGINIKKDSKLICHDLYASYKVGDNFISANDYSKHHVSVERINDVFGEGFRYIVKHTGNNLPALVHSFYVYPEKDYFLTDFMLEGNSETASNYMAPINVDQMPEIIKNSKANRALFVPFDNDCWIRYRSCPLTFSEMTSYEVTTVFNNENRDALVVGSVEHDAWKTGVTIGKGSGCNVGSLICFGGIADQTTRDSKSHGALRGKKIKSPKCLMGLFDDWRDGMEEYAQVNATVTPPKAWEKAVPFGWNSWGTLQFNLTYFKALEVSNYFKQNLQCNHFANEDNLVYIGLDSGWNSFSEKELKDFVDNCKANGQVAGIYWTPFTDWGKNPDVIVKDFPSCTYQDIYLYANGKPQELDGAYALDPTHPAVEAMMKNASELFHRTGFEYVKLDFMTHGAMEADKWYNPEIQTGIQAYNYGMKLIDDYFGDMYINLSISPIFPAHYAQSRRIACDAWNKIKDTEYTLNALSYGWWLDRVYQFNDPDHIVLREATEGENRARVTSGVITGIFITGDDFSNGGQKIVKEKAMNYLTNAEINAVANGKSFRPVYGNSENAENQFVRLDEDGNAYYAVFNYSDQILKTKLPLEQIGLDSTVEYNLKELWSGKESVVKTEFDITVPPLDVAFFKIDKNNKI
ncbi:MAG: alpha-galactosidase [Prevotella sp.]|nr:alpha-galactosidase [Prevotella sp.]